MCIFHSIPLHNNRIQLHPFLVDQWKNNSKINANTYIKVLKYLVHPSNIVQMITHSLQPLKMEVHVLRTLHMPRSVGCGAWSFRFKDVIVQLCLYPAFIVHLSLLGSAWTSGPLLGVWGRRPYKNFFGCLLANNLWSHGIGWPVVFFHGNYPIKGKHCNTNVYCIVAL